MYFGIFFVLNRLQILVSTPTLTPTLPPSLEMSIRHSQALLWQTVDSSPFSSLYLYMFFAGFSEILRRWKAAGKLLTLLAFARVLGIYFPTVSAWY